MFDYQTRLNVILDILKSHNTTTASPNLSASLTTSIVDDNIVSDDAEVRLSSFRADRFPAIFIRVSDDEEEPGSLGQTGASGTKKFVTVNYEILGIVARAGAHTGQEAILNDVYTLARNIKGALAEHQRLDGDALWSNAESVNFSTAVDIEEGSWIKGVLVSFQARYLYR